MANPWDFSTPVWLTECEDYPTFVGSECSIPVNCGVVGIATDTVTGLDHLEGMTVAILADGEVLEQQVVQNGQITLEDSYAKIHVGLPFVSDIQTLSIEVPIGGQTLQGKRVKIGNVVFRVADTRSGWVGGDEFTLYDAFDSAIIEKLGDENMALLYSGDLRMPLGSGYQDSGSVFYRQYNPVPVSILMIIPEISPGGPAG